MTSETKFKTRYSSQKKFFNHEKHKSDTQRVCMCVCLCVCVRVIHSRTEVSSLYEIENLSTWGMELRPFQYVTD